VKEATARVANEKPSLMRSGWAALAVLLYRRGKVKPTQFNREGEN
jgi:hypothetical protein